MRERLFASPIIADPDEGFLKILQRDPHALSVPPILNRSEEEAIDTILLRQSPVSAVFLNIKLGKTLGIPVIRSVLEHRPMTRVYIINDGSQLGFSDAMMKGLGIRRVFNKPLSYGDMLKAVYEDRHYFDPRSTATGQVIDPLNVETDARDQEFVSVMAQRFMAESVHHFDIYVRIRQNRYLKVLQAGDSFTRERLSTFLTKGITHFHLRRESQEVYLQFCDDLAARLLRSPRATTPVKASAVLNHGHEIMGFLKQAGVSEKAIDNAQHFVQNANELVNQIAKQSDVVARFLKDTLVLDHAISTSLVTALLIRSLNIEGDRSVHVIGLAALLHDIALLDEDPKFTREEEWQMDPLELQLYRQHPMEGAILLRGVAGVDPTVIQAIEQHHERRDRSGFPNRVSAINRTAEIIGLSEEFLRLVHRAHHQPTLDPWREMERSVLPHFSVEIADAFRNAFPRF